MNRFQVLAVAIMLAVQTAATAGPGLSIGVVGQLNGGNNVSASCSVSATGQASGAGALTGTNPSNGYKYSYPFTITKVASAPGKVILTGNLVAAPTVPVTLTATVPNGPVSFVYVIGGKSYSYTGTGVVTIK